MNNRAPFCSKISLHQRRFVILDHSVCDFEFTVKINYDKKEFGHLIDQHVMEMIKVGHLIDQYVMEMIKAIKENRKLCDAGWNNCNVLVEETEVSEYFGYCFFNSSNLLKKKLKNVISH